MFHATVSALTCVQCVSVEKDSCLQGNLPPTPCVDTDDGSTYCLKSVGTQKSGHGHVVYRTCSKTLQTNCTPTYMFGDLYNVCHHSCVQDGCNTAPTAIASMITAGLICLFHGL
ncbi:hypothetical protein BsWGS_21041 [Bradybaena similaris]